MRQADKGISILYLKRLVLQSLHQQGYRITKDGLILNGIDKDALRQTHVLSVQANIKRAESALRPYEEDLLAYIANGDEVSPTRIRPKLVAVQSGTEYSRLFRYASLHWSIPISNGYGRRLRFLLFDESNSKLMGILGLSDPVFSLRARDEWVGWNFEQRKQQLFHVMDAYVLGAVPPYSRLLCGKFVAMIAASCEVRKAFQKRYSKKKTTLHHRNCSAGLALVTTTSALGRSSLYNRLKFRDRLIFESVGYTAGWGTFHFANGIYDKMLAFAHKHCQGTAKAKGWGGGEFRSRREVIRKCLQKLGLPHNWMIHQIQREVFVAPLARNSREFLRGEANKLSYWEGSIASYYDFFRERWLLPRSQHDSSYLKFRREEWRLWRM